MKESKSRSIWKKAKKMKIKKEKEYVLNFRKKILLGIIDILILNWIKKQPICGQDIMKIVLSNFNVCLGSGTLYPILYNLQNKGFIESKLYNKKKIYFLTKKGKTTSAEVKNDYFKTKKVILNFLK